MEIIFAISQCHGILEKIIFQQFFYLKKGEQILTGKEAMKIKIES